MLVPIPNSHVILKSLELFNRDQEVVVIAHTKEAATKMYRKKVCFAYDNLPEGIRRLFPIAERTQTQLVFENGSSIEVTSSARGGTPHFLHISEMGKIAAKYPERAIEITTGSLQGVPKNGLVFIESTAEGKAGAFYDLSRRARGMLAGVQRGQILRRRRQSGPAAATPGSHGRASAASELAGYN
jgi:hypothetical protein